MRQPIPSRRGVAEGRGVSHRQNKAIVYSSNSNNKNYGIIRNIREIRGQTKFMGN